MPNDRSTPEKVFCYGIGIFGSQIECYRIGDEFFLYGVSPAIWRRLDVPLSTSLLALHDIIQIAMSWTDSHLFAFCAGDRQYGVPYVARLDA